MIWFIAGIIVFFALVIRIFRDSRNDCLEGGCLSIAAGLVCSSVTALVLLFSSAFITDCAEVDYKVVSDTKIVALKDNQNTSGNFYIMGGYVDENLYYYYATETEFGYKTEKVEADNAYIKYTDGAPHIERYVGEFVDDKVKLLGSFIGEDRYIIYCPYGTVTNEFVVDLE